MTGRIISLRGLCLLCLCMVFCLWAGMSVEAATLWDFEYAILEDGTVAITGYSGSAEDVLVPEEIAGKRVTKIGSRAFSECTSIRNHAPKWSDKNRKACI